MRNIDYWFFITMGTVILLGIICAFTCTQYLLHLNILYLALAPPIVSKVFFPNSKYTKWLNK